MKPANYAPIYACVYAQLAEIAREHGYALAAHGSLAADFDLVCIPWQREASDPQTVVDAITKAFAITQVSDFEPKEHGRIATTISFSFGECRLDLSFMPTVAKSLQGDDYSELGDPANRIYLSVNGVKCSTRNDSASYEEIVRFAGGDPERKWHIGWVHEDRGGNVIKGQSVQLKPGMRFVAHERDE